MVRRGVARALSQPARRVPRVHPEPEAPHPHLCGRRPPGARVRLGAPGYEPLTPARACPPRSIVPADALHPAPPPCEQGRATSAWTFTRSRASAGARWTRALAQQSRNTRPRRAGPCPSALTTGSCSRRSGPGPSPSSWPPCCTPTLAWPAGSTQVSASPVRATLQGGAFGCGVRVYYDPRVHACVPWTLYGQALTSHALHGPTGKLARMH